VADERSLSELERLISRNHTEISADVLDLKAQLAKHVEQLFSRFGDHLLIRVYEADERARQVVVNAVLERVRHLEDERAEVRRGSRAALTAAVVAVFSAIATVVINALVKG
jgi:hypothetical protein